MNYLVRVLKHNKLTIIHTHTSIKILKTKSKKIKTCKNGILGK